MEISCHAKTHRCYPQLPWLLLPCSQSCKSLSFFSVSEGIVRNIKLPEAAEGGWCFGSSNGWLMMARGTEYEPEVFLLNPLSGFQLNLPSLTTIFPYYYDHVDASRDRERFASFIGNVRSPLILKIKLEKSLVLITFAIICINRKNINLVYLSFNFKFCNLYKKVQRCIECQNS